MKRRLVLVGLVLLMLFMLPSIVEAYPELTHEYGTEIRDSGGDGNFIAFHYTIYDDVDFGGYLNVTNDFDSGVPTAQISLLNIFILDEANWIQFLNSETGKLQCDKLYELWDINITSGQVAWNYTQYTSVEYNVHIAYWYYEPGSMNERQVTFDYEHWDWARYQPPVTTTTTTTTTTTDTTTTTTTTTTDTTTTTTETTSETTTGDTSTTSVWSGEQGMDLTTIAGLGIAGVVGMVVIGAAVLKRGKKTEAAVGTGVKVLILCPYCGGKTEQGMTRCQKCGADL